ncbi:glycine betaine/L-proline ABC transporter substrate-binding protein ProX [Larsenimonas salina]|uniref:glycine betaine/L-proline ABC transporter substrate-binding protein ProX n=1 Tax=Larsenimonas salina TaxID=1295565 RepID=UPI0020734092|nr:glycine betaine/L-proline ABC transporter substrate-binding protein ProX [Larsenimonas salina]MCM5704739.1 glycine betaine/L-proline ABC transporter substrate-binding protein ProX [Larsenimonas salina]
MMSQQRKSRWGYLLAVSVLGMLPAAGAFAAEQPGEGVTVTPIFPTITEEHFRGQVAVIGLEELGYEVEQPKETDYPTMMMALSYGDADFTVHLWDNLHDSFYQRAGGDDTMVKVGDVMDGVIQGYLIDKKTAEEYGIDSLDDLRDPEIAALFDTNGDGKADMTGCNPGWGCEVTVDHHLAAYDLMDTVTQNRGSYFALMADTITRYEQGEPILYFTWVPQWITAELVSGEDVVWLEVPYTDLPDGNNDVDTEYKGKNLGFAVDTIKAVLNRDFAEENPAAREFLSHLAISVDAESAQNLKMQQGESSQEDIRRHAEQWVEAHREQFDEWLAEARAAAE